MSPKSLLFLIPISFLFCMSCSPKLQTNNTADLAEKIFYPRNADTAHFQYLKGFSTNTDIEIQSKFQESMIGKKEISWMRKPYGVTVEKSKIYVADIGLPGINIIDLNKKTFNQFKPIHKDFSFVLSMAIDENDDMYILDSKSMTVLIYDANGKYKETFKILENSKPTRIKIKGEYIYIGDIGTGKINIYSKNTHQLINQLPKKDITTDNEAFLFMPMDFDLDDNYIYVLDAGAYKVKIFTYEGELVKVFGEHGNGYGLFIRPKTISVDKEGNIFVADSTTQLVQMFNKDGKPLMVFGAPYEIEQGKFSPGLLLPTSMVIDYNNLDYFKPYVDSKYNLKYLVYVMNQSGSEMLKVYGRLELK
ncbi:MAG: hypothetical protein RQ875_12945 [Vicingaceae bacterium]|nr:hypothetical protein [Vicingaceae bacterium]